MIGAVFPFGPLYLARRRFRGHTRCVHLFSTDSPLNPQETCVWFQRPYIAGRSSTSLISANAHAFIYEFRVSPLPSASISAKKYHRNNLSMQLNLIRPQQPLSPRLTATKIAPVSDDSDKKQPHSSSATAFAAKYHCLRSFPARALPRNEAQQRDIHAAVTSRPLENRSLAGVSFRLSQRRVGTSRTGVLTVHPCARRRPLQL